MNKGIRYYIEPSSSTIGITPVFSYIIAFGVAKSSLKMISILLQNGSVNAMKHIKTARVLA